MIQLAIVGEKICHYKEFLHSLLNASLLVCFPAFHATTVHAYAHRLELHYMSELIYKINAFVQSQGAKIFE